MAMPLGLLPTFLANKTPSPTKYPSCSLRLVSSASSKPFHAKMRTFITYATASNPTAEPKKRLTGITKTRKVSPELKDFLGGKEEVSRSIAIKEIWAYIKEKQLQDPVNKQVIVCDEKLKKIFGGKDRVGFLEISGLLTPHMLK
ncbi:SWIB domain-containing protein [Artemisia annua]|uniref:SWIB domain-containing protein n=1 Tax=Artemisia annua TaxID=35608 RepID=A0A2U1QNN0_ARTAN|nr:SWIB domain-containing protein [Artemisia annua]